MTATVVGTNAGETISGTEGADTIVGLGGDDTIDGLGGNDRICGGSGQDAIDAASGNDRVLGGSGNDVIAGAEGADILRGGGGADTLDGGLGDDGLSGDVGEDTIDGGDGTDTCATGETLSECEVVPPSGCANEEPLVPATPQTTNVVLTGSNAHEWVSSVWLIPGGNHRITVEAEVRNNTSSTVRLGKAFVAVYNASGTQIGERSIWPYVEVLRPGERAVLRETWPSLTWASDEDNFFPAGWVSWKLIVNATIDQPEPYDRQIITGNLHSLAARSSAVVTNIAAVNTLEEPLDWVGIWIVLYDSRGALIRVIETNETPEQALEPGAQLRFQGNYGTSGHICWSGARWGAWGGVLES
jgi:Ca2+-binding RTX toxin-like protein